MKWQPTLAAALLIVAVGAPRADAQGPSRKYGDLLKRIPDQANAMLLVDVDALFNSPLGQREKWRERAANRPTGVLGVSTDASKFVVAAAVDLDSADERWKLGMLQTHASPPALTALAAREGGYVEQLQTQNVAWTPRNFYLFAYPERIVGFAVPTDRQLLTGWIRSFLAKPRTFPPSWADRAIYRADAGAAIVLAVNLDQAFAPKQVEDWLRTFQSETVQRNKINFDMLAGRLAGAKSAFLQVDVKETIEGTIRIDFEYPVDMLRPVAKELILAAVDDYGAGLGDLKRWTAEAKDKTITLSGRLSEDTVRRILSFIAAPRLTPAHESYGDTPPSSPGESTKAAPPSTAEPSRDAGPKATQQYYRSVIDIVQTLKGHKADSQRSAKVWYDRSAKQIEDLPLLNVDSELLDWGSAMARNLREMASGINYAQKDTNFRIHRTAGGYYGGYGYGGDRAANAEVIKKQYADVMSVQLDTRWQAIETSVADMRRKLVTKYKVDF